MTGCPHNISSRDRCPKCLAETLRGAAGLIERRPLDHEVVTAAAMDAREAATRYVTRTRPGDDVYGSDDNEADSSRVCVYGSNDDGDSEDDSDQT